MTTTQPRLRWVQRANRFFADGDRGTYRVRPGQDEWVLDFRPFGDEDFQVVEQAGTSAEAKRMAAMWNAPSDR
jgi:hypothetical protein